MTNSPHIEAGTPVRFTANRLGLIESVHNSQFEPETVSQGDTGVYLSTHPNSELAEQGWHLIEVVVGERTLYAPVHESHFEVADA